MKLKDVSILIADDEPDIRDLLMEELAFRGAKVEGVESGKKACIELSKNKYDVLLSDVRMPGGDGVELVKRISAELSPKPLLFLCTGSADFKMEEAVNYGVVEIFAKPFNIDHIVQVITDKLALTKKAQST